MRLVKIIGLLLFISAIVFVGASLSIEDYHPPAYSEISILYIEILDMEIETTTAFGTTMFKSFFHMAVLYLIAAKRMHILSAEGIRLLIHSVVGILKKKTLLTPVIFQSKFRRTAPLSL